jgi:hypothetical protein
MKIVVMNNVLVLFVRFKARIQLIGPGWGRVHENPRSGGFRQHGNVNEHSKLELPPALLDIALRNNTNQCEMFTSLCFWNVY